MFVVLYFSVEEQSFSVRKISAVEPLVSNVQFFKCPAAAVDDVKVSIFFRGI